MTTRSAEKCFASWYRETRVASFGRIFVLHVLDKNANCVIWTDIYIRVHVPEKTQVVLFGRIYFRQHLEKYIYMSVPLYQKKSKLHYLDAWPALSPGFQ